jgi:hypothetical protein
MTDETKVRKGFYEIARQFEREAADLEDVLSTKMGRKEVNSGRHGKIIAKIDGVVALLRDATDESLESESDVSQAIHMLGALHDQLSKCATDLAEIIRWSSEAKESIKSANLVLSNQLRLLTKRLVEGLDRPDNQ